MIIGEVQIRYYTNLHKCKGNLQQQLRMYLNLKEGIVQ